MTDTTQNTIILSSDQSLNGEAITQQSSDASKSLDRSAPDLSIYSQPLTPEVLGNEIVKLFVGKKRKEFTVHRKLLCDRSKFFAEAFKSGSQKAKEGVMYMPEYDPEPMAGVIDYLYRRYVPTVRTTNSHHLPTGVQFRKLYYLAEKLCLPSMMDKLLEELKHCHIVGNTFITTRSVSDVYNNTCENSKLRLYYAAFVGIFILKKKYKEKSIQEAEKFAEMAFSCPQALRDVILFQAKFGAKATRSSVRHNDPTTIEGIEMCYFHTHKPDEACPCRE
ncbi:hypothetical protein B0O99DRAFT_697600 [Bisporella sp. PMI_857]|nr:hypothetical protein B0O99DRAFT_697600 [Bisporella sp. PMI_857]